QVFGHNCLGLAGIQRRHISPRGATIQGQSGKENAGFCCQVPADPAFYLLEQKDFRSRLSTRLSSEANVLSKAVVGNYCNGPITAEPCRAKTHPLRPRRSYFAPMGSTRRVEDMVEAPGTAPGSDGFITMAI